MNDDARSDPPAGLASEMRAGRAGQTAYGTTRPSGPGAVSPPRSDRLPRPPQTGGWRNIFASLRYRGFLYLWVGLLFSMGGIQMQMIARGYLTYEITDSPFLLGLVNAGFALPMLCLALFGGAIADRMDRKRVIQLGQAASGVLALFVAVSISTGTVSWYHLLAVSMVGGGVFSFFVPARQALIPHLVGKDMLTNAMALNAAGMSVTTLLAPTAAGVIYAWAGVEVVYYIIAGMGVVAMLFTRLIQDVEGGAAGRRPAPMLSDIGAGLSYIRRSPLVMVLLAMGLATTLLAMPFRFLMPIFVVDIYGRGPEALGLLVSVMGVGALVGSLFVAALGKQKRGLLLLAGSFLSGIGLMMVAAIPVYVAAIGIMALLGLGDSSRRTVLMALIMEEVEDRYRGRVMSVFMMNFGLMPLGALPAAAVAQIVGGREAVGLLAVLLIAATLVVLITQRRLRQMD